MTWHERDRLGAAGIAASLLAVALLGAAFRLLYAAGSDLARRRARRAIG
jgi:hypothetical protein